MKELSGAEPDKAVDYEKQTISEIEKVQSKAILLNDMLDNAKEGERIGVDGDVYDQVAQACNGARPKIQQWIEKDNGEHEGMMDRLLLCNDLINNALERYQAAKKGDWEAARAIAQQWVYSYGALPTNRSAAGTSAKSKGNDLISFDAFADDEDSGGLALPSGSAAAPSATNPGFTAGGLPLDLFAPSPSNSPAPAQAASAGPSTQRKDPMAFFNSTPSQTAQPQQQYGQFGGLQQSMFQQQQQPAFQQQTQFQQQPAFQQQSQFQQPQPQAQQQFNFGGSLTPSTPYSPSPNAQNGSSAPAQQPKKNDAFADLVDLMG